jgi:hypothetical protein
MMLFINQMNTQLYIQTYQKQLVFFCAMIFDKLKTYYKFMFFVFRTIITPPLPIQIDSVTQVVVKDQLHYPTDITHLYLTDKKWASKVPSDSTIHVDWTYDGNKYSYYYDIKSPLEFPPYSIEKLREKKSFMKKIVSATVNGSNEYLDKVKQYAGPFHDFYGRKIDFENLIFEPIKTIELMNTFGEVQKFDSNIVEL